jgi:hypothetical protein
MTFEQALAAMRRGEKVRREGWEDGCHIFILNDVFYKNYHPNDLSDWEMVNIASEHILATDWQIVPSESDQKLHEFNGA